MTAWAITLALGATLVALAYLAVQGLSWRGKLIAGGVIAVTVASEVAAAIAYRNSTDGQTVFVWVAIPIYGLLALAVLRLLDRAWRRMRQRPSAP